MPSPLVARLQSHAGDPVTDQVRDEIGGRLNDAFVRGDLDDERYQRLLALLFQGRTLGELVPVAEALPRTPTYSEPDIVRATGSGALVPTGPGTVEPVREGRQEPARRAQATARIVVAFGVIALVLVVVAVLFAL